MVCQVEDEAVALGALAEGPRGEFGAVVDGDRVGRPALPDQPLEHADDPRARQREVDLDPQALAGADPPTSGAGVDRRSALSLSRSCMPGRRGAGMCQSSETVRHGMRIHWSH